MDTNKLKHCPFCNEIACIGIDVDGSVSGTVGAAQVSCIYCGVTTPFFVDVYDAVETWNARAERTTPRNKHRCVHCKTPLAASREGIKWTVEDNYCCECGAKVVE